jgi:hypothetical protein
MIPCSKNSISSATSLTSAAAIVVENQDHLVYIVADGSPQGKVQIFLLENSISPFDLRADDVTLTSYTSSHRKPPD